MIVRLISLPTRAGGSAAASSTAVATAVATATASAFAQALAAVNGTCGCAPGSAGSLQSGPPPPPTAILTPSSAAACSSWVASTCCEQWNREDTSCSYGGPGGLRFGARYTLVQVRAVLLVFSAVDVCGLAFFLHNKYVFCADAYRTVSGTAFTPLRFCCFFSLAVPPSGLARQLVPERLPVPLMTGRFPPLRREPTSIER